MDRAGRYAARLGRRRRYTPPDGLQSVPQERVQNAPTASTASLSPRSRSRSRSRCHSDSYRSLPDSPCAGLPSNDCTTAPRRRCRNDTLRTRGICPRSSTGIPTITCPSAIHPPPIQDCHPPLPQDPASCIRCDHLGAQRKAAACAHGRPRRVYLPDDI